jgi:hypothetical protein
VASTTNCFVDHPHALDREVTIDGRLSLAEGASQFLDEHIVPPFDAAQPPGFTARIRDTKVSLHG